MRALSLFTSSFLSSSLLSLILLSALGCQDQGPLLFEESLLEESDLQEKQFEIIGGNAALGDKAVVALFAGGLCTGTLIAPEIVLTAAHCVGDAIESGNTSSGSVRFGDGRSPWIDTISIIDMSMHRFYNPPAFLQYDIALVRLARPAPSTITPLPISKNALTQDDVGLQLRVVGFGNTDGAAGTGAGEKRQVTLPVKEIRPGHIGLGDHLYNTCQGDSGGPSFATFSGVEQVVGVTSYGASGCAGLSYVTRTDAMWDSFLSEVISAWSGPCKQDGQCIEDSSCQYLDPDCDVCGMDGVCGSNCPNPDRDCPLAGLAGDSCSDIYGCESRICSTSTFDEDIQFCSMSCDPNLSTKKSGCFAPLTICEEQSDGTGLCRFAGITPGAQGYACKAPDVCHSGICDTEAGICVKSCGDGLAACSDGFECISLGGEQVCTLPSEDSGWCSTGGSQGHGLGAFFLLLALVFVGRRNNVPRNKE